MGGAQEYFGANFQGQPQRGAKAGCADPWWQNDADESYGLNLIALEPKHLVAEGWYELYAPWSVRVELTEDVIKHLTFFAEKVLERFGAAHD